ncbi:protein-disulfide reductase DsbD domain-containing protein [Chitinophagaceae bacterium MMS25-I14]
MIRILPIALLSVAPLLMAEGAAAQMVQDPTSWTYEVKKKKGNEYDLIFHLKLKDSWHIYALVPGGDGSLVAPSFSFDKDAHVVLKGEIKQEGKIITKNLEGIDGAVNFLAGKVDYVQTVVATGNPKVTGKYEYQVCNDNICLPPKKKTFEFDIK